MFSSTNVINGAVDKTANIKLVLNILAGLVVKKGSKLLKSNSFVKRQVFKIIKTMLITNNIWATYIIFFIDFVFKKEAKNINGKQEIIDGVKGRK